MKLHIFQSDHIPNWCAKIGNSNGYIYNSCLVYVIHAWFIHTPRLVCRASKANCVLQFTDVSQVRLVKLCPTFLNRLKPYSLIEFVDNINSFCLQQLVHKQGHLGRKRMRRRRGSFSFFFFLGGGSIKCDREIIRRYVLNATNFVYKCMTIPWTIELNSQHLSSSASTISTFRKYRLIYRFSCATKT